MFLHNNYVSLIFTATILATTAHQGHSVKYLMITPGDAGSHFFIIRRVGEALAESGHNVTFLSAEREALLLDDNHHNFTIIRYPDKCTKEEYDSLFDAIGENVFENPASGASLLSGKIGAKMTEVVGKWSDGFIENVDLEQLRNESFDLIFLEALASWCAYAAKAINVPFVTIVTMVPTTPIKAWASRTDVSPAYYPTYSSGYDSKMDFKQRFQNTFYYMVVYFLRNSFFWTIQPSSLEHFGMQVVPSSSDILAESEMWFMTTHFALDFPRSLPANAVAVGGLLTRPSKPLDKKIEAFVKEAGDDGVVLFSFGSYMRVVKEEQMEVYLQAFKALPQRVVMKWASELLPRVPNNTLALKWLPLNDLLGHQNVKLLVYHCGSNGIYEALYHAVPIICIPLWEDHFDIARRVVSKGIGIQLDLYSLTTEKLTDGIRHVLETPKYQENINKLSAIFRDEPQTPIERVVYWMEFIVRHGGVPHLRSAAYDLNMLQYYLVDVIAAMVVICLFTIYLGYKLLKFVLSRTIKKTAVHQNGKIHKTD